MNEIVREHDLLWLVLDSLRYDVAESEWRAGRTPNLRRMTGERGWEKRHAPGNFTLPSHLAFFAGFLPTPSDPAASRERLFALRFAGSESTGPRTKVFDERDIVRGLKAEGYRTVCVGGVGFFNRHSPISSVLPDFFDESYWRPEFGVTCPESAQHQCAHAAEVARTADADARLLLFVNFSAIHQPNFFFDREADAGVDTLSSHAAALRSIDQALPLVLGGFAGRRRPLFAIVCSDHGTAYGEGGFSGHRVSVPAVWEVPYADGWVDKSLWI